jgi:hypothetical protein
MTLLAWDDGCPYFRRLWNLLIRHCFRLRQRLASAKLRRARRTTRPSAGVWRAQGQRLVLTIGEREARRSATTTSVVREAVGLQPEKSWGRPRLRRRAQEGGTRQHGGTELCVKSGECVASGKRPSAGAKSCFRETFHALAGAKKVVEIGHFTRQQTFGEWSARCYEL